MAASSAAEWDADAVLAWLRQQEGVSDTDVDAFRVQSITGAELLQLDRQDLKDLGLRVPLLRKMSASIQGLKGIGPTEAGLPSDRIRQICPALLPLLGPSLLAELDGKEVTTEAGYWMRVEVLFVLRVLVLRTSEELASAALRAHAQDSRLDSELPYAQVTARELEDRVTLARALLLDVEGVLLELETLADGAWSPLFAQVVRVYDIPPHEKLAVQFVILLKVQQSHALRALLPGEGVLDECEGAMIRYVCGLSQLQLRRLSEDSHPLLKDRIVESAESEWKETISLSAPDEVCKAMLGEVLAVEDKLKLSGTKLLEAMQESDGTDATPTSTGGATAGDGHGAELQRTVSGGEATTLSAINQMLGTLVGQETLPDVGALTAALELDELDEQSTVGLEDAIVDQDELEQAEPTMGSTEQAEASDGGADDREPRCYTCELEYLNDQFSMVMQQVQQANQRLEQELKDSGTKDSQPRWMRESEGKKRSIGELTAKLKLAQRKIDLSLQLTREEGSFYPRLEGLVDQLGLDTFEKSVILYLAGSMISPIFKSAIQSDSMGRGSGRKCTVGDLLGVFCASISEQVAARPYFYRTATLLQKGLIRVCKTYGAMDLTDQELQLDRRVLDCIVGLDKESNEVVEGSHLYEPKVDLESVVLPTKLKACVTQAVMYFDKFKAYRKRSNFDQAITYGVGLTLMFCGPSGTGKTMTANAIAAMLGKKMLLVNFPRLAQVGERGQDDSAFQSIFREAELSDAIIFFDECESMFAKRSSGGSAQLTELLTELERFEGIVFLATNRPYDLDEAMYRRISEVFDFKPPTHIERAQIWRLVTAHDAIPCEDSIDWEAISLQYELTGGFIKNTVIAALLSAVGRDHQAPMITQADIIDGCKKQMRGALQMLDFEERLVPKAGLDELIVSESVLTKLQAMVKVEKARSVLFGPWGFPDDMRTRQGTTSLFWGPAGTGRSRAAEAVGFELGKPLKVVDFPQLLMAAGSQSPLERGSGGGSSASTAVKEVFKEARLMDAVLVLDGYTLHTGEGGGHAGGGSDDTALLNLTIKEMTRFPGVVILMIDTTGSLDVFVGRLDKGLLAGLKFLVEFGKPSQKNRTALWKKALPPSLPTSEAIDFAELAKASAEFSLVQIGNAVYRAAAAAALRRPEDGERGRAVSMADLQEAIDDEKSRGESEVDRWVRSQYM